MKSAIAYVRVKQHELVFADDVTPDLYDHCDRLLAGLAAGR